MISISALMIGYDLSQGTLDEAIEFLTKEKYSVYDSSIGSVKWELYERGYKGKYCLINVYDDIGYVPTPTKYNEFPVLIIYNDNLDILMDQVGSIACGGMYTAVGLFETLRKSSQSRFYSKNYKNITKERLINMKHQVPPGDQEIR